MTPKRILIITPKERGVGKFTSSVKTTDNIPKDQVQLSWKNAIIELGHACDIRFPYRNIKRKSKNTYISRILHLADLIFSSLFLLWITYFIRYELVLISANSKGMFLNSIIQSLSVRGSTIAVLDGLSPKWTNNHFKKFNYSVDLVFTNSRNNAADYRDIGYQRVIYLPFSAFDFELFSSDVEHNRLISNCHDELKVGFVGTLKGKYYKKRREAIKTLAQLYPVHIWTFDIDEIQRIGGKAIYCGTASRSELSEIYAKCDLWLNIYGDHMLDGGNLSAFEIAGCGKLQLCNISLDEFYSQDSYIFCPVAQDMYSKIFQLRESRSVMLKMQAAAKRTTLDRHTYEKRFEKLLEECEL